MRQRRKLAACLKKASKRRDDPTGASPKNRAKKPYPDEHGRSPR